MSVFSAGVKTSSRTQRAKSSPRCVFAFDDSIVCVLKGGFTSVETTLMADGKFAEVENLRRSFQRTMKERFTQVVEEAVDREVIVYMSQIHSSPDVAVEFFILHPSGERLSGMHEFRS